MEKLGGRKYILSVGLVILSYILVFVGKITPKEWTDFVMVIAGAYIVGNVGSKIADGIEKK